MLKEKISNNLKEAMKSKDALKVSCLRMIMADIKNAVIAKKEELSDEEIIGILQKQTKQHKDSIEGFKKGNRQDLVDKEAKELKIIEPYLPQQLSTDEITNIVKDAIEESGAKDPKEMGKVMRVAMPKLKGRADGKEVNKIVAEQLNKNAKKE